MRRPMPLAACTAALLIVLIATAGLAAARAAASAGPVPVNVSPPAVSGVAVVGQVLSASAGTWHNSPLLFAYQWSRCDSAGTRCVSVTGATTSSYVLSGADVGSRISVTVTASNPGGAATASSAPTSLVPGSASPAPVNLAPPSVSGSTVVGQLLTASAGSWHNTPSSYAYQWSRCDSAGASCAAVSGATASAYQLSATDLGSSIEVTVTATNSAGSAAASSTPTAPVTGSAGPPTGTACTIQVSSVSALQAAIAPGATICLTAGTYGSISIAQSGTAAAPIVIEAAPAGSATIGSIVITGSFVTVRAFSVNGGVFLDYPAHDDVIDHNDVSNPNGPGLNIDGSVLSQPQPGVYRITMSGNKVHDDCGTGAIASCEGDAIHISGWGSVTITGNEIYNTVQNPAPGAAHTDVLQSYDAEFNHGACGSSPALGCDLTFDHNYMHDNNTEGFFIKDGSAANVSYTDNLGLRNPGGGALPFNVYDVTNLTMTNNTDWSSGLGVLQGGPGEFGSLTFTRNVWQNFENAATPASDWTVSKSWNIYGTTPFTAPFAALSATESVNTNPSFVSSQTDDYRLASNPNAMGVDWRPVDQKFGP
jgi:hypothetical protein